MAAAWVHTLARQARLRLPCCDALRCALTLGSVHFMAHRLLFAELVESGVPVRLLEQLWPAGLLGSMCCGGAAPGPVGQ